jgi:Rod binding domain-containing protein
MGDFRALPLAGTQASRSGSIPIRSGAPVPLKTAPGGVVPGEAEKERVRTVARQFEAVFLSYLFRTMKETVPDSPFSEDPSGSMYEGMFEESLGNSLAEGGGVGLADMLLKSLERKVEAAAATTGIRRAGPNGSPAAPETPDPAAGLKKAAIRPELLPITGMREKAALAVPLTTAPADQTAPAAAAQRVRNRRPLDEPVAQALDQAADKVGVDRDLLKAVALAESGGNPSAVSPRGARGLMQLMAATAREMGVDKVLDPLENAMGGARYLKRLLIRHGGDERLALASYNAGPGAVERHGGVPPYRETREYIERVLDYRRALKSGETS